MNLKFEDYNNNPKQRKTGDCVIRAIAKATGKTWYEIFDELTEVARKKCTVLNNKHAYELYLKSIGWIKQKQPKHSNGTKYTIRELIKEHQGKTIIIRVRHHLTVVHNNTLYDTADCRDIIVGNYWIKY